LVAELVPFIVSGLVVGAIYGLAGTGLVLTYKTSGIFNFGHGAVAAAAAYLFYWLHIRENLDWPAAFVLSVMVLGVALGFGFEVVARRLARQRPALKVAGTIGTVLIVQGLATIAFGPNLILVPQYLPAGTDAVRIGSVNITYAQIITVAISLVIVAALYALFRFARIGVAMRAVVDDPDLVALHGTSPRQVRRIAWVVGATLAALSGVLIAPIVGLQAISLTFIVVQAFGAAAIGAFSSLPLTFLGGLGIGVAASISTKYAVQHPWLSGVPDSMPFIVLLIALLVIPRRRLAAPSLTERHQQQPWRGPAWTRGAAAVILLTVFALVPLFAGVKLPFFTLALIEGVLLLSLGLLVRTSGIVSLCHAAFAAIGAVAFSQFALTLHLPWVLALLLGALVVVPVAALLAIPARRLSGLFLALATFGFGIAIQELGYTRSFMFSQNYSGRPMPRPGFATGDTAYYYVVLAVFVLAAVLVAAIHRGRLGRLLRGLADSSVAVSTMGLNVAMTRVIVFCISGYLAGIAGVLYGSAVHFASYGDPFFGPFASLVLLTVLVIQPFRQPWYAVAGIVLALIPGYLPGMSTPYWLNVMFGLAAVVLAMRGGPHAMPARLRRLMPARPRASPAAAPPARERALDAPPVAGLQVRDLTVRFGGLVAVERLSLSAPRGHITGLIGPNGAGKTTIFNSCSGLVRPTSGQVRLDGSDISAASPARRGQLGLGRTFQVMELCETLTVAENVTLGREAALAGSSPLAQILEPPRDKAEIAAASGEALALCGISHLAGTLISSLSTGQRRLVELARCVAGSFSMLLLDEPSSGLDDRETDDFRRILEDIVARRHIGVLLVEHDMSLVMQVCDYIYVMDFGKLLFHGTPAEVAGNPLVRTAYLGEDSDAIPAGDRDALTPPQ